MYNVLYDYTVGINSPAHLVIGLTIYAGQHFKLYVEYHCISDYMKDVILVYIY